MIRCGQGFRYQLGIIQYLRLDVGEATTNPSQTAHMKGTISKTQILSRQRVWGKCTIPHSPPGIKSLLHVSIDQTQLGAREQERLVNSLYTYIITLICLRAQSRRRTWESVREWANGRCSPRTRSIYYLSLR